MGSGNVMGSAREARTGGTQLGPTQLGPTQLGPTPKGPARLATALGIAGLIPFAAGAALALVADDAAAARAALLAYGAVILSFLGAVHWGLALASGLADTRRAMHRFAISVLPSLLGWAALLLPQASGFALATAAFALLLAAETLGPLRAGLPGWYLRLRIGLTLGALVALAIGAPIGGGGPA